MCEENRNNNTKQKPVKPHVFTKTPEVKNAPSARDVLNSLKPKKDEVKNN